MLDKKDRQVSLIFIQQEVVSSNPITSLLHYYYY
jgi:hypothetical protein